MSAQYHHLIQRYRKYLPVRQMHSVVSLGEGNTPLIKLGNISRQLNKQVDIYVKFEGLNPTGSFKDRGMTVAITKAVEAKSKAIVCASTGNTAASAAAYAARAGLMAFVLIPEGKIAVGKLAQAMMHGAVVVQITGNFDEGMELVKEISDQENITIVNSINPYRLEGQKTAAFEIVDALGCAPDYHCLPVGNAGNISACWMGYQVYQQDGKISNLPKMIGYQAQGAAPFVLGHPISHPDTVATAIRIGNPQSWDKARAAQQESGGWFASLEDPVILAVQRLLAAQEGIFCEPASAISVAGVLRDIHCGKIPGGTTVVCTLTGHGLKDPMIAMEQCQDSVITIPAEKSALEELMDKKLSQISE